MPASRPGAPQATPRTRTRTVRAAPRSPRCERPIRRCRAASRRRWSPPHAPDFVRPLRPLFAAVPQGDDDEEDGPEGEVEEEDFGDEDVSGVRTDRQSLSLSLPSTTESAQFSFS